MSKETGENLLSSVLCRLSAAPGEPTYHLATNRKRENPSDRIRSGKRNQYPSAISHPFGPGGQSLYPESQYNQNTSERAKRYREILTRRYNWAMEQYGIRMPENRNPAAKVERYKERTQKIKFLTHEQIDEQLQAQSDNFSQTLAKINKANNLLWTCFNSRHTFGSQLAMKGESLYKISRLMGNSTDLCRKHYTALIPELLADCVNF